MRISGRTAQEIWMQAGWPDEQAPDYAQRIEAGAPCLETAQKMAWAARMADRLPGGRLTVGAVSYTYQQAADWWRPIQEKIVAGCREAAPGRDWVMLGGVRVDLVRGIVEMPKPAEAAYGGSFGTQATAFNN